MHVLIFLCKFEIYSTRFIQTRKIAILPYLILTPILFFRRNISLLFNTLAINFLSFESAGLSTILIQLEAKVNEYLVSNEINICFWNWFQLPVVLSLLARIGVVDSIFKRRKYVVVIIFATAALLTPPDPITQIGLAIPLLILYELSIFSVKFIENKKLKDSNA